MNQIFNKIYKKKKLVEEESTPQRQSLTCSISSTMSQKFTRKQSTRKSSAKSLSQDSSQSSLDRIHLSKFYVKMRDAKENTNCQEASSRLSIIEKIGPQQKKKRQPTPIPGFNNRIKIQKERQLNQQHTIQKQLQLLQLSTKLKAQISQKQSLQKRLSQFDKQLKQKVRLNEQLHTKIRQLQQKQGQLNRKLSEYQQIAYKNENNYVDAKTKLQKMKLIIKNNRCNQLQSQNRRLNIQNNTLIQKLKSLQAQYLSQQNLRKQYQRQLSQQKHLRQKLISSDYLSSYMSQIQSLKNKILLSKSDKQKVLQEVMMMKSQELLSLKSTISKLQIHINFINRRKNQQIGRVNQKRNKEVSSIRQKLRMVSDQCSRVKYQYQKLKNQMALNNRASPHRNIRSCLSGTEDSPEYFKLELSP